MNISTLAKILGVSVSDLRETGTKHGIYGFSGRNTRIPYNSATAVTKILRPDKAEKLKNDDKIYLPAAMTVSDFASDIGKPAGLVVKTLMMNGVMTTLNEKIDYDTAQLIAEELRVEVFPENDEVSSQAGGQDEVSQYSQQIFEVDEKLHTQTRPPVVTVMGHVDHGKTTLLDTIRKADVAGGEAGAITQHISSYQIEYNGKKITFVDTPGHEAFTAMRARGSQLADFIILMVSAVEGPKPQTVEVIERAKLTKTPLIVAINKTDLPDADIEKTKNDIAAFGVVPEEWGGDVPFIPVSAKTGDNINAILDAILLHAEVAGLQGQPDASGQAVVVENQVDPKLGVTATVLITHGTISVGDVIRTGINVDKVKKLVDSNGKELQSASIAEPVQLLGFSGVVSVGEQVKVYSTVKEATVDADQEKLQRAKKKPKTQKIPDGDHVNVVLVADVAGSLEALKESLVKIPQEQVRIVIKRESVGQVTESDVEFAQISDAVILAFHTTVHGSAAKLLRKSEIPVVESNIIYEILQWIEEEMLKHIKHEVKVTVVGQAEVLKLFTSDKGSIQIMGGEVRKGKIYSSKAVQVVREGKILGKMDVVELQRNKQATDEVFIPQQFGISLTGGKFKVEEGDTLESIDETIIK